MIMGFIKPIDLPGKRIRYRSGYDGYEPKILFQAAYKLSEDQERFVVVVETSYPGVLQDGYVNKAIVALVQRAINENGLHVICEDIYSPGVDVPEELPGTLSEDEEYLLINTAGSAVGSLLLWMYCWACGGLFYGSFDLILDMIIPRESCDGLRESLKRIAEEHSVNVEDRGCAADRPGDLPKRSFFRKLIGWLK